MKIVFRLILFTTITFILTTQAKSLNQQQLLVMRQAMEDYFTEQQLVGFQAVIYADNEIVTSLNLGYADLEHKVPVTDHTRFEIASITKAFTALALYKLEEQDKIDLTDTVQTYVPEFPLKPEGEITINHLAGFLSGIRHYRDERTPLYYATHYDDVVDALAIFKDDPLIAKPGERFFYTSYGYNLLAAVIQRASEVKFQDYIQQIILDPLAMHDTGFINVRIPMDNRARTYSFIEPYTRAKLDHLQIVPTLEHSYNAGGGNLYSSAKDLAVFGSQFLQAGFVSESILEKIYSPHFVENEPTIYGDGWYTESMTSPVKYIAAAGSYPGTTASLMVFPERKIVISFLSNTWGKDGPGTESGLGTKLYEVINQE